MTDSTMADDDTDDQTAMLKYENSLLRTSVATLQQMLHTCFSANQELAQRVMDAQRQLSEFHEFDQMFRDLENVEELIDEEEHRQRADDTVAPLVDENQF